MGPAVGDGPRPVAPAVYRIDTAPANTVFLANQFYLRAKNRAGAEQDFTPPGAPPRFADELAWFVWVCATEGARKIEPSLLRWCCAAVGSAATEYHQRQHRAPTSITDLTADVILRHAVLRFERRNQRLPSPGTRRNISGLINHLHLYLSVRCTDIPWWAYDTWDLLADPRIPQREHEPRHDQTVNLAAITPVWLREGMRFWLRTALSAELLRWTSAVDRARDSARHFGPFLTARGETDPLLSTDPTQLRGAFTEFTDYLRSPAARAKPDVPLTPASIDTAQSQTQVVLHLHGRSRARSSCRYGQPAVVGDHRGPYPVVGAGVSDPPRQPGQGIELVLHRRAAADAGLPRRPGRRPRRPRHHHPPRWHDRRHRRAG